MKKDNKTHGKKIYILLTALLILAAVSAVGTTFGRYDLGTISFPDANWESPMEIDLRTLNEPSAGEGPGIVEETPTTVYQVQPDDTLPAIAEKFHTTVEALIAYNKIEDPDSIQAGMILRIPPTDYVIPEEETGSAQAAAETELSSEAVSEDNPSATTEEMPTSSES